jgi:hypothetical protein
MLYFNKKEGFCEDDTTNKTKAILVVLLLAASSLIAFEFAAAQTAKPSAPEFTVKYIRYVYSANPTLTTAPRSGETYLTGGYYSSSYKIEIAIKNQPAADTSKQYFFSVREKSHNGEDWGVITEWIQPAWVHDDYANTPYPEQDYSSQCTVLSFQTDFFNCSIDFQVQALVGNNSRDDSSNSPYAAQLFTGEASDWSPTQTLTINNGANATATPDTLALSSETIPTPNQEGSTDPAQLNLDSQRVATIALVVVVAVSLAVAALLLTKGTVFPIHLQNPHSFG